MINKKILYTAAGIAIVLIAIVLLSANNEGRQIQKISYVEANSLLKEKLAEHEISMSSPIKLQTPDDIKQYCTFFTDAEKQKNTEYCTSTELTDRDGQFLGNIHMIGSSDEPKIVLVLIQTDPTMSQIDSVKVSVDTVIQNLVCDCWHQVMPGNFENTAQWVDGLRQFHLSDTKPHSKSKQLTLEDKSIQLELSTNKDGYLWQFFIYG
ncbi:MAG: hypothetical protein ACT4NT_00190 [Nitrososphaerota archaeon]